jgi:signal transduction histidine kinase
MARSTSHALVGGVCAGLAVRLGIRERSVRVAFSLSCLAFGAGLLIYLTAWLFVPRWSEEVTIARRLITSRRESHITLVSLLVALIVLALLGRGHHGMTVLLWTSFLNVVASIAIWYGSSRDEKNHLEALLSATPILGTASARGWRAFALRVIPGAIMLVIGIRVVSRIGGVWSGLVPAVVGGGALTLGVGVLLAPWWLDSVRDLSRERRQRVRVEERAKLVAHVHDSVLQTLTLIEKAASNPADVVRLARAQERELRHWLFSPESTEGFAPSSVSLAHQLRRVEIDVEENYDVTVELVTVGDCPGDERVTAIVAAAREAAVNAAKWARVPNISIFGEVDGSSISVFVRDTGVGFDFTHVEHDRHGIRHSIVERMKVHGGTSEIRSVPGAGTEVHLTLERSAVTS